MTPIELLQHIKKLGKDATFGNLATATGLTEHRDQLYRLLKQQVKKGTVAWIELSEQRDGKTWYWNIHKLTSSGEALVRPSIRSGEPLQLETA